MGKRSPGSKRRYTPEEVARVLSDTGGIVSNAAARLGCTRETVYQYIRKYAKAEAALREGRERTKDFAESQLIAQMGQGNITAIIFYLKTQGRDRGYSQDSVTGHGDAENAWWEEVE